MYDFRNHGNSGEGTLPWITWGPTEALDVVAAVDYIGNHPDYNSAAIGLLCLGDILLGLKVFCSSCRVYVRLRAFDIHPIIYPPLCGNKRRQMRLMQFLEGCRWGV